MNLYLLSDFLYTHLHTSSLTTIRSRHHLLARRSIKTRHCIKKLDGSIEHEDPGIDIILPPFFLCLRSNRTERLKSEDAMHSTLEPCLHPWGAGCQEHLEMIWSLVRLKVVTSWKPSLHRCVIFIAERLNDASCQQTKYTTVQCANCANRTHFAESLAFVNHLHACGACAPIHDFAHYVCITLAYAAAERGNPPLSLTLGS